MIKNTVKPVCNDRPRDPKFLAVVDRWFLLRGSFKTETGKLKFWSLLALAGGHYSEMFISSSLTVLCLCTVYEKQYS